MAKFWDTITQMPINCAEEYPDWRAVLLRGIENTNRLWFDDAVLLHDGFAIFDRLYTSAKIYALVRDFIGPGIIINISNSFTSTNKNFSIIILFYFVCSSFFCRFVTNL